MINTRIRRPAGGTTVSTTLRTRVLAALAAAALPVVLAGTVGPAAAATSPAGGFAGAYGLLIDTTLLQGNVPLAVGPLAPSASSCPPATGLKEANLLAAGDAQVAKAAALNTLAGTNCTAKDSKGGAETLNVDAL